MRSPSALCLGTSFLFLVWERGLKRACNTFQEVVEVLQEVTGHELFYNAYNACRARQRIRKEQRWVCARLPDLLACLESPANACAPPTW